MATEETNRLFLQTLLTGNNDETQAGTAQAGTVPDTLSLQVRSQLTALAPLPYEEPDAHTHMDNKVSEEGADGPIFLGLLLNNQNNYNGMNPANNNAIMGMTRWTSGLKFPCWSCYPRKTERSTVMARPVGYWQGRVILLTSFPTWRAEDRRQTRHKSHRTERRARV